MSIQDDSCQKLVSRFLMNLCLKEREIELKRQFLADMSDFEPYLVFRRLLRKNPKGVDISNLEQFLKDNFIECSTEVAQDIIQYYDVDSDGMLSYKEFMDMVLPKEHPDLRAFVTQKECFEIEESEYLSYETEAGLADLLNSEIQLMRNLLPQKKLLDKNGITASKICSLLDNQLNQASLNFENLRELLNDTGLLPYDSEIVNILRKLDRDEDGQVSKLELDQFLQRFSHYSSSTTDSKNTLDRDQLKKFSPGRSIVKNKVSLISSRIVQEELTLDKIEMRERRKKNQLEASNRKTPSKIEVDEVTKEFNNNSMKRISQRGIKRSENVVTEFKPSIPISKPPKASENAILREMSSSVINRQVARSKSRTIINSVEPSKLKTKEQSLVGSNSKDQSSLSTIREIPSTKNQEIGGVHRTRRYHETDVRLFDRRSSRGEQEQESSRLSNSRVLSPRTLNTAQQAMNQTAPIKKTYSGREDQIRKSLLSINDLSPLSKVSDYEQRKDSIQRDSELIFDDDLSKMLERIRRVEESKQDLANDPEFNIRGLFLLLDPRDSGRCYLEDFRTFMSYLNIQGLTEQLATDLYKEIKGPRSIFLSIEDISRYICPRDQGKSQRLVNGVHEAKKLNSEVIKKVTMVFSTAFEFNRLLSSIKHRMTSEKHLISRAFEQLDQLQKRNLSRSDFEKFAYQHCPKHCSSRFSEIDILFENCDIDKDGDVNFKDFYMYFSD